MNRSTIAKLLSLFGLAAFLCVSAASADPTDPAKKSAGDSTTKAGITAHLGKVHLEAEHVKVHKRTPIAHKPLDIVDKAGKKISADTMITLSNGKKVKAGPHFAELNKLEQKLNEMGHSLRDAKGGKVLLQQTNINEKERDDQAKKVAAAHAAEGARNAPAVPKVADLEQKHLTFGKLDADRLQKAGTAIAAAAATTQPTTAQTVKQWNYTLGNKKLVAAYLNGKLEVKGSKDDVTVTGSAAAGGYLINKEISLIKANGSVYAAAKGTSKANLHVYLLGQHVINLDKSTDASLKLADTKQHSIDVHADLHFSIGPVPITAKLGAKGNAGVRYMLAVRPANATLQVTPFVDARVDAQVAVDLGIASGGAGGEVILLKDELTFGAELGLDFDPTRGPKLTEHVYAQNKMTALSGKVYAFVRIHVPFFSDPEYHHDIFSWKGIQSNGYLFNLQNTNYLVPNYQAIAATSGTPATSGTAAAPTTPVTPKN